MLRPARCHRRSVPICGLILTSLAVVSVAQGPTNADGLTPVVVLADPADPYHSLAREIADRERAPIATTPTEAIALQPDLLIWVVSPLKLSDRVLVDYGRAVERARAMPALGFISGSSLELARSLYARSLTMANPLVATVWGDWGGHSEVVQYDRGGSTTRVPLALASFRRVLSQADAVMYSGHGGGSYLRFDDSTTFFAQDVPSRVPPLVATYACNTFRIWTPQSVAMAFADRGAAAYVGYSYSPVPGFQMTEGFPFRHTWPGFPIGRLVQLQSAASMRGLFTFPAYYLLGNPRLSVRDSPPYRTVADRSSGGERLVTLAGAPADIIPVRIDGGATFETTEVAGLGRVWRRDPFYNGRLQILDVGADRYLLLQHTGGPVTIRLSMDRPILATIAGVTRSGLDLCLVVFPMADRATCGAFAVFGLVGLAWGSVRKTRNLRATIAALGLGGLFAAGHVGYVAFRVSRIDVVSPADRALHAWMFVATWALVGWGAYRFLVARTWKGHVVGVALAVLNASCMVFVWLGWPLLFNARAHSLLGEPLYNLRPGLLTLIGMTAIAILVMVAFASTGCVLGGVESAVAPSSDGLASQDERR
jgi:hypothetical protein